jgi:DNA-binding HxlR family transcriptional regulator
MNRKNMYGSECPTLHALNIIGGKWRLPILYHLMDGALRYNELKRRLSGITNIMLTRSLKDLEEHGLLKRIQHSEIPPHVEYYLTDHAKKLAPALLNIEEWGKELISLDKGK